MCTGGL
jgi:hypothetical protein